MTDQTQRRRDFVRFEGEAWLAKRLGRSGILIDPLFDGVTDADTRRARLRQAILELGPDTICGVRLGMQITYRDAFEKLYGVAL